MLCRYAPEAKALLSVGLANMKQQKIIGSLFDYL